MAGTLLIAEIVLAAASGGPLVNQLLRYSVPLTVVAILILGCLTISRFVFSRRDVWIGGLLLSASTFFLFDPYSSGRTGGDLIAQPMYPWQLWLTVVLICLQMAALCLLGRDTYRAALSICIVELLLYCAVNVYYVTRDGFVRRAFTGYSASPLPLLLTCAGFGIRILVVVLLNARHVQRHPST